jgi:hypothetical protein
VFVKCVDKFTDNDQGDFFDSIYIRKAVNDEQFIITIEFVEAVVQDGAEMSRVK